MDKVTREGKVAVLVSSGFGAGWSTWAAQEDTEAMLFHPEFVKWVEEGKAEPLEAVMRRVFGERTDYPCDSGSRDLEIEWLDTGTAFIVEEYDGSESLRTVESLAFTA